MNYDRVELVNKMRYDIWEYILGYLVGNDGFLSSPETKIRLLKQRGLQFKIENLSYCVVIFQESLESLEDAERPVSLTLVRNHIHGCIDLTMSGHPQPFARVHTVDQAKAYLEQGWSDITNPWNKYVSDPYQPGQPGPSP